MKHMDMYANKSLSFTHYHNIFTPQKPICKKAAVYNGAAKQISALLHFHVPCSSFIIRDWCDLCVLKAEWHKNWMLLNNLNNSELAAVNSS